MKSPSRTCRWVCRRIPLLVGGELASVERRKVERHLIGCPTCRDRRTASAECLSLLRGVAPFAATQISSPAVENAPSLWPALARQIRDSRHQPDRLRTPHSDWLWRYRTGRLVGVSLAASLLLGLAWFGSGPIRVVQPVTGARIVEQIAPPTSNPPASDGEPAPVDLSPSQALTVLEKLDVPSVRSDSLFVVSPSGGTPQSQVLALPSLNPFDPPLTLRLDYDLDRGTIAGPIVRDTQRAY